MHLTLNTNYLLLETMCKWCQSQSWFLAAMNHKHFHNCVIWIIKWNNFFFVRNFFDGLKLNSIASYSIFFTFIEVRCGIFLRVTFTTSCAYVFNLFSICYAEIQNDPSYSIKVCKDNIGGYYYYYYYYYYLIIFKINIV